MSQHSLSVDYRLNGNQWVRHRSRRNVVVRKSDVTGHIDQVQFVHEEDCTRFLEKQPQEADKLAILRTDKW